MTCKGLAINYIDTEPVGKLVLPIFPREKLFIHDTKHLRAGEEEAGRRRERGRTRREKETGRERRERKRKRRA